MSKTRTKDKVKESEDVYNVECFAALEALLAQTRLGLVHWSRCEAFGDLKSAWYRTQGRMGIVFAIVPRGESNSPHLAPELRMVQRPVQEFVPEALAHSVVLHVTPRTETLLRDLYALAQAQVENRKHVAGHPLSWLHSFLNNV